MTPTIATTLKLKPLARTILSHLEKRGSITPLEAMVSYGTPRIAPSIYDLRNAGFEIEMVMRQDERGHKYGRYSLMR